MAVFTGQVRLADGTRVPFEGQAPRRMSLGWATARYEGETWSQAHNRMLSQYPGTSAMRVFMAPGKGIASWSSELMQSIPDHVDLIFSWKDWPVNIAGWLDAMPDRTGRTWLCVNHEPEQGTSAGDPTVAEYHFRWSQLITALAGHPRRREVGLVPIHTHYWAHWGGGDWRTWWSDAMADGCDGIGWDVYHRGWVSPYDGPAEILALCRDSAEELGLPWLMPEFGSARLDSDPDGEGRAAWLTDMVTLAHAGGCRAACWYHHDAGDLTDTTAERVALTQLITTH